MTESVKDQVRRIADLGLRGIKMHPNAQEFDILCPQAFEAYARGTRPRAEVQGLIDAAKGEPWFARAWVRPELPAGPGFWPDMDFGPAAVARRVAVPTLLFYGEDDEWCLRITRAGWKLMFEPAASVVHHGGQLSLQRWDASERLRVKLNSYFDFQRRCLPLLTKPSPAGP